MSSPRKTGALTCSDP